MRVEGGGIVYAAPSLVHHYVVAHEYRPPDGFIVAVLAWNATAPRWARRNSGPECPNAWPDHASFGTGKIVDDSQILISDRLGGPGGQTLRGRVHFGSEILHQLGRALCSLPRALSPRFAHQCVHEGQRSEGPRMVVMESPGSAMFAILPRINEGIREVRGSLCLWWPLVGEPDAKGPT